MPLLFDKDLSRVTVDSYITGKSSINFPLDANTGGWHFMSYYDREKKSFKVSLAGLHFPDTSKFFGDTGVINVTEEMVKRGLAQGETEVYMASHERAAADMIVRWAQSESRHCNVEVAEWFPRQEDQEKLLELLLRAKEKLEEAGLWEKINCWMKSQKELGYQGIENSM